ncbi:DJ-1/PfpI family protein [Paenibacillus selenitireducens]|uniref:DJ-1/PfpI family protein n=1 Tax=Paenibacillus selenitireducens TaxID=1324314 RepID=A0A1T2WYY4_9BACL|nr:DJ-1/PfpI family protein [Paenibacillus selenitireducens]OPA72781.1 DJ-1/PfpI family protein [Paenibacillus selenitireducens]
MKTVLRIMIYLIVFIVIVGGTGAVGFVNTMNAGMSVYDKAPPALTDVQVPKYDANKPTVAVLLANEATEVFDFLVPYEMFAMTEAYNVYGVAPDREIKSLTGGLDVVPHYSFDEMDAMLGKSPDIIVIPFMPILDEKKYAPVREWIRKHSSAKTTLISICNGAENLADTGLLNGKSAATHWGDINRLIKKYPEIHWVKDRRYVPQGNIVSSAGLTSGIDATLYVISQQLGEAAAKKVAKEMNYPSYDYVTNPQMKPFDAGLSDITYVLNNAFQWNKVKAGVLLYNGADELDLSAAFDTYAASGTTTTLTVSSANELIVTKHGLNLVARYQIKNVPKLANMIVVGADAESAAAEDINQWKNSGNSAKLLFLHRDAADRFAMDPAFEDLAGQEDIQTAKFAAKRLEYRATDHLKLEGSPFSFEAFGIPVLLGILSLLIAFFIDRRFIRRKKGSSVNISASRG